METIVLIVLGIVALIISFYLLKFLFIGAVFLFAWATEQGFVGAAVYFAAVQRHEGTRHPRGHHRADSAHVRRSLLRGRRADPR